MNLHGSITDFQNTVFKLYLQLEHRFKENVVIRELWSAMAHDVSQQISSLKAFPPSFWNQLKRNQDGLLAAARIDWRQIDDKNEDLSLRKGFELTLQFEEPTILKIYVPIIRSLRENWTNSALEFYIIVKAHLARILRVMESFSGDPMIIQRSSLLFQSFEKEVQEPKAELLRLEKKSSASRPAHRKALMRKVERISRPVPALAKRAKALRARTTRMVKKVDLQRRRARR